MPSRENEVSKPNVVTVNQREGDTIITRSKRFQGLGDLNGIKIDPYSIIATNKTLGLESDQPHIFVIKQEEEEGEGEEESTRIDVDKRGRGSAYIQPGVTVVFEARILMQELEAERRRLGSKRLGW